MDLHHYRPDQLKQVMEKGANLLDLRSPLQFCEGYIPDSLYVPDSWIRLNKLKLILQEGQPIILVKGNDSSESIKLLKATEGELVQGIAEGGFEEWQESKNDIDVVISVDAEELGYEIKFGEPKIIDMRFSEAAYKI
jgi:rhodanese-related sulfurtransferase